MRRTTARRRRRSASRPASSCGSAWTTCAVPSSGRGPRRPSSGTSRATTSSRAIRTGGSSASMRMRSTATTTTTEPEAAFDLELTETQQLVQRTAREFATEKLLPIAHDIDEQGQVPPAILAELAALGFMGVYVPEELGGAGADVVSYILASEEVNRACASTGVIMQSHNSLVCDPLLHHATKAQQERWLRPLAKGEKLGCFALTEPASGAEAARLQMAAKRDGSGWILNGTKNFITNGVAADVVGTVAQTEPGSPHQGITAF